MNKQFSAIIHYQNVHKQHYTNKYFKPLLKNYMNTALHTNSVLSLALYIAIVYEKHYCFSKLVGGGFFAHSDKYYIHPTAVFLDKHNTSQSNITQHSTTSKDKKRRS